MSFWLAMPLSAVIAGLFAALIGAPLLRLKGHYFAVATLGVAEGLREVVINLPKLTGGGGGITVPTFGADALTGSVGAAHAFQIQSIYPDPSFDIGITVLMVVMVVLGGAGTVLGPVVGAVAIAYMSEWLREHYTNIHTFILGGMIILAVVLLPQGFVNYLGDAIKTRRFSLLENVRRYRL